MTLLPLVSVVIPCRNERGFIEPCLDSLLASDYPRELLEVLVADGMSNDGTRESLQVYIARHPQIRLIDNPKKIVPTGLNQSRSRRSDRAHGRAQRIRPRLHSSMRHRAG